MFYYIIVIIIALIDLYIAYKIIIDINQLKDCNCFIENVNLKAYNPKIIYYREELFILNFLFIIFSYLYIIYSKHYNSSSSLLDPSLHSKYTNMKTMMKNNKYMGYFIQSIQYIYILFTVLSILGYLSFIYNLYKYDKNDCDCTKELKYLLYIQILIIAFLFTVIYYI